MKHNVAKTSCWARGLMLLSAIILFAATALPAAAMPKGECCADMPCHEQSKKVPCPDACVLACQTMVAPEAMIVEPAIFGSTPIAPVISPVLQGLALAPELPPPR